MVACDLESLPALVRVPSYPGGTARQYRVQVFESQSRGWSLYANFAHREQASACWQKLVLDGHQARIVDDARSPVAA